jgi:hypothetical protein
LSYGRVFDGGVVVAVGDVGVLVAEAVGVEVGVAVALSWRAR